jgi:hypothetical protein
MDKTILIDNAIKEKIQDNVNDPGFFASKELQEQRENICKSCDSFTTLNTCKECGCIMPLKNKIKSATCPLGKW